MNCVLIIIDSGPLAMQNPEYNDGNFRAVLRLLAQHNADLKRVLENAQLNATCLSPKSQNSMISFLASEILNVVKRKIGNAFCFSILADDASRFLRDHLSIVIRFVDEETHVINVK